MTTEDPKPVIPHPDRIAEEILARIAAMDNLREQTRVDFIRLRKQLKLSCECYGVKVLDPSAARKKSTTH
jgi:hypothetical protein